MELWRIAEELNTAHCAADRPKCNAAPAAAQEKKAKELEELNRTLAELGIQQPAPADVDAEAEEKKRKKKKDKCEPALGLMPLH